MRLSGPNMSSTMEELKATANTSQAGKEKLSAIENSIAAAREVNNKLIGIGDGGQE